MDLQNVENSREVSLVAVAYEVSECQTYYCRDGLSRTVQQIILVGDTRRSVSLTLWGDYLNKLDNCEGTALIVENISTKEYRGLRTLSTTATTVLRQMDENPTVEQAYLQNWWDTEGKEEVFEDIQLAE